MVSAREYYCIALEEPRPYRWNQRLILIPVISETLCSTMCGCSLKPESYGRDYLFDLRIQMSSQKAIYQLEKKIAVNVDAAI